MFNQTQNERLRVNVPESFVFISRRGKAKYISEAMFISCSSSLLVVKTLLSILVGDCSLGINKIFVYLLLYIKELIDLLLFKPFSEILIIIRTDESIEQFSFFGWLFANLLFEIFKSGKDIDAPGWIFFDDFP